MKMAASRLALLCLLWMSLSKEVVSQRRCSIPVWPANLGNNPLTSSSGKVLLIAILRGYCSYCVGQAQRLEELKNNLASEGVNDIMMIIINGGEDLSRRNVQNLRDASNISVLQDTSDNRMSRQVFRGNKDDFVVYDRCGQRAAYIPHPYSYLGNTVTRRVLRAVHAGRHNCQCSLDNSRTNPHNVMYGDQPVNAGHAITQGTLGLDCPSSDTMCTSYLRNHGRNHEGLHNSRRHRGNLRNNRRNRMDPMMSSQQDRLSNRPRVRPHQEDVENQQGQGNRGRGGRNHQRHQLGSHQLRNGGVAWDCTNISLSPVIRVPTHRCRCPNSDAAEECVCTRPIYGRAGDILSWHCGCHNPTSETRAQCDHCHVCDRRPVCRDVTQLATWQEQCRCQQGPDVSQASSLTWQWQNANGTTADWQVTDQTWQTSASGTWQWHDSAGDVVTTWQWQDSVGEVSAPWQWSSSSSTDWQQQSNSAWQSRSWQWQNSVNSTSTSWQWQTNGTNWQV